MLARLTDLFAFRGAPELILERFGVAQTSPGRSGPPFWRSKRWFFRGLLLRPCMRDETAPTSKKHCKNQYETHVGPCALQCKNHKKLSFGRLRRRSAMSWPLKASRDVPGPLPGRSRVTFKGSGSLPEPPRGALGASRVSPGASRGRPKIHPKPLLGPQGLPGVPGGRSRVLRTSILE